MSLGDEELLTGIRSAYFCRMRSASALRFSKGCSSLNLERMVEVLIMKDLDVLLGIDEADGGEGLAAGCRVVIVVEEGEG